MANESCRELKRNQMVLKWSLLLFISLANVSPSSCQKLHFLSVINTDNSYRLDRRTDAENINKIANGVSAYLNIEKLTYSFGDSLNFNPETVKLTLKSMDVVPCSNDIVWFHYSGDGNNTGNSNRPTMRLFGGDLEIKEVERIVAAKNPKLLLITVDASNLTAGEELISNSKSGYKSIVKKPVALKPTASFVSSKGISHYQTLKNYRSLFKDFENSKIIIITSSSKGEDSFSDKLKGSFWVQAFDKAMSETVNNKAGKDIWKENLFSKLSNALNKISKNKQHPAIYISQNIKCEEE